MGQQAEQSCTGVERGSSIPADGAEREHPRSGGSRRARGYVASIRFDYHSEMDQARRRFTRSLDHSSPSRLPSAAECDDPSETKVGANGRFGSEFDGAASFACWIGSIGWTIDVVERRDPSTGYPRQPSPFAIASHA